jgi:hypothetical protein
MFKLCLFFPPPCRNWSPNYSVLVFKGEHKSPKIKKLNKVLSAVIEIMLILPSPCHTKKTKNSKNAKIAYVTSDKCPTVTLSYCYTKKTKNNKNVIMFNLYKNRYFYNCDPI